MEYTVNCVWDDETSVWVATSDDIPGLVLESGSLDALMEKAKTAVPKFTVMNNLPSATSICFKSECRLKVYNTLTFDLRGYAKYLRDHGMSGKVVSEDIVKQFQK